MTIRLNKTEILIIGYLIDLFILERNHVGYPMTLLTPDNMISEIKVRTPNRVGPRALMC